MNLLFRVLSASACRSTHHKLAMDALLHLTGPRAERQRNLLLLHHGPYLDGAKAPDTKFKDFRNHVLHVGENFWGGAPAAARSWYGQTVTALRGRDWAAAAYAAGVMSHYYTDPLMPFHTGQSEAENNVHRAAEWSITKSYEALRGLIEAGDGYPSVRVPDGTDWLEEMVRDGARLSHPYYDTLIRHYDFARGVKNPPAGLDDVSRGLLARVLGHATIGLARILEKAFEEAGVEPPEVSLTLQGFLAALRTPIGWVTSKLADVKERALVQAMYAELQATGKVEKTLSEDDRSVRTLHHEEVVAVQAVRAQAAPLPPAPPAPASPPAPAPRILKFRLEPGAGVGAAPSIGPKTQARLEAVGVETVADLLAADPAGVAEQLGQRGVTRQTVSDWQDQARLACRIPQIHGHDAQLLVACGYRTAEAVASAAPQQLLDQVSQFAASPAGQRILRGGKEPDLEEVGDWISWARQARGLRAA